MSLTLIVTPQESELRHLTAALTQAGWALTALPVGDLTAQLEPSLGVVLARGGHGKAQFGVQTRYLLDRLDDVTLVACVGASGGLQQHVAPGDVVVATETVEHDYRMWFVDPPLPRFPGHEENLSRLRTLPPSGGYSVHFGPVASGDEDVIDSDRVSQIVGSTGALAVAWEGAGGARACALTNVPFVEIRAVTDHADPDAPKHFAASLAGVMANLGDFLDLWLAGDARRTAPSAGSAP